MGQFRHSAYLVGADALFFGAAFSVIVTVTPMAHTGDHQFIVYHIFALVKPHPRLQSLFMGP